MRRVRLRMMVVVVSMAAGCGILAPERAWTLTVGTNEGNVIDAGTQVQLVATATFKDGRTEDVTRDAVWNSRNEAVALVSPTGLVVGVAPGAANVGAEYGDAWAQMSIHVR
jgi:hypothetical protein